MAAFGSMAAMRLCDAMLPALGRSFEVTTSQAAATVSAFAIGYGLMQLFAGALGDRLGKPRVIAWAALCCGAAGWLASCAPTLALLVVGRVLMGACAAGVIPLAMAWIGDHVALAQRQVVLARLLNYTLAGMMTGAWAGGVLADAVGWRGAFALIGLVLVGAGLGVRRRVGRGRATAAREAEGPHWAIVGTVLGQSDARRLYAITLAEGALVFGVLAFVPAMLHDRFALPLSWAGGVLALFGLGGLAYARAARWLVPRCGRALLAVLGGGVMGVAFVGLGLLPWWWAVVPACLASGFGYYLLHGTLQTCATELSAGARATAVSLFACALFLGQSAGVAAVAALQGRGTGLEVVGPVAGMALLALGLGFRACWRREDA
jgi:predicted MFS family arabinose efflux permease